MTEKAKASKASFRKTAPSASIKEAEWGGFIDVRLTQDDKENYEKWTQETTDVLWQMFADCVDTGMKYGLSFDKENDCYISTFTAVVIALSGKRYCLTARSGTWGESLSLLIYKHQILLNSDWGNFRPSSMRSNWG